MFEWVWRVWCGVMSVTDERKRAVLRKRLGVNFLDLTQSLETDFEGIPREVEMCVPLWGSQMKVQLAFYVKY